MIQLRNEKVLVIVQARMGSTRLPGKILRRFSSGLSLLELLLRRLKRCQLADDIMVAFPETDPNDIVGRTVAMEGVLSSRGSEHDVLDRFYRAAMSRRASVIARVCGDNPLTDPEAVDRSIKVFKEMGVSYLVPNGLPLGTFAEIFSFDALCEAWDNAKNPEDREHVTSFIYTHPNKFTIYNMPWEPSNWIDEKLTVDTEADFNKIDNLILRIGGDGTRITLNDLKR